MLQLPPESPSVPVLHFPLQSGSSLPSHSPPLPPPTFQNNCFLFPLQREEGTGGNGRRLKSKSNLLLVCCSFHSGVHLVPSANNATLGRDPSVSHLSSMTDRDLSVCGQLGMRVSM